MVFVSTLPKLYIGGSIIEEYENGTSLPLEFDNDEDLLKWVESRYNDIDLRSEQSICRFEQDDFAIVEKCDESVFDPDATIRLEENQLESLLCSDDFSLQSREEKDNECIARSALNNKKRARMINAPILDDEDEKDFVPSPQRPRQLFDDDFYSDMESSANLLFAIKSDKRSGPVVIPQRTPILGSCAQYPIEL